MTPRSFPTPEDFREKVRTAHDLSDGKPFGVNLHIVRPEPNQLLQTFLDISIEGVKFVEMPGFRLRIYPEDQGRRHHSDAQMHDVAPRPVGRMGVDAIVILGPKPGDTRWI